VLALRARQRRALLLTLLLSAGVPLLLGGDELGRTQRGNNNAYCQDNEITWFEWTTDDHGLLDFTTELIALRSQHPAFRRRRYRNGKAASDLRWFTPSGAEMTTEDWSNPSTRSVALFIDGATDPDVRADGMPMIDDDFLMLVNSWWEPLSFTVPDDLRNRRWNTACNSFDPAWKPAVAQELTVGPRSAVVLQSSAPRPTNP
jgi:glycogen operon protein